jgi:lysophospholipase L1-like esterase
MRCLRLVLPAALLLMGVLPAAAAPTIAWEVANRFRLFKSEQQFRRLAEVYDALPASRKRDEPAFAFEDAMQRAAAARRLGPAFGDPASIDRYGWTSAVTRNTCFSATNRGHWSCELDTGDQFMEPKVAHVRVKLDDAPPALAGRTCHWSLAGRTTSARCSDTARIERVPFGVPFDLAVRADGAVLAELRDQTIRHVAIVGFGDSFSSGEGNPDRPVELVDSKSSTYLESSPKRGGSGWPFRQYREFPLRRDGSSNSLGPQSAAVWLSTQCHRSLYSQHVRAALLLALAHRDIAVSLMAYSCTGAETRAGLLGYYAARDDVGPGTYDASPQLMRYWRDFCGAIDGYNRFTTVKDFDWRADLKRCATPRRLKPDAVLLSVGGNDIGFSSVVANEVVARENYGLRMNLVYRLWLGTLGVKTFDEAREAVRDLIPRRIRELSEAFKLHLDVPATSIVQTGYPQMMRTGGDGVCAAGEAGLRGMDVHRILAIADPKTGKEGASFIPFLNGRIESAIAALPPERRWRFVDSHVERFVGHAICNEGAPDGAPDGKVSGETRFPNRLPPRRGQADWEPFAPSAWRAYRPRERWFVTPNDSFLGGHYMRVSRAGQGGTTNPQDKEQPLLAATLGGAFHPNASGHSAIADATIPVLREILKLPAP